MNECSGLTTLLDFIARLDAASIFYSLSAPTERAILVSIVVPGERWEVEFFERSAAAVEVFSSAGTIEGPEKLADLFDRFKD